MSKWELIFNASDNRILTPWNKLTCLLDLRQTISIQVARLLIPFSRILMVARLDRSASKLASANLPQSQAHSCNSFTALNSIHSIILHAKRLCSSSKSCSFYYVNVVMRISSYWDKLFMQRIRTICKKKEYSMKKNTLKKYTT